MRKITLFLLTVFICTGLFSQNTPTGKRISITNPSETQLLTIKDLGIDLSCGANFVNNDLILEVSSDLVTSLDQNFIPYNILIDDLTSYYENVTLTELPQARAKLALKKQQSLANKSLSISSTTIDNLVQYEGCSEIDWDASVPNNFNLGSMAGCLTYSEVLAELDEMRALYPNLISVKTPISTNPDHKTHGNSYTNSGQYDTWAGQDVLYVRISDNPDTDESNEPESLYSGMTHSREVSSMMNLMYYMWYILENYDSDTGIKNLVDNHEMYFIPVANPDGLMWNEQIAPSGGGMQRKNLGPYYTGNNDLRGVDLNRNYDYFWGSAPQYGGSSGTQSSNVYRGPSAFSEPETQGIEAFVASRNFVTAMNHHATSNLIPHAYNGYPAAPASGREDDFAKWCHDMTRYNRYIYGEAPDILTIANGDMSDWMLGGASDVNGSTGSGKQILALAPENGAPDGSEGGFWPSPSDIVDIAQRAMRMNFMNVYYSGKFAQFHDLNTSNVNSTSGNFKFAIEYLGQTLGGITLDITPVSPNISSITPPAIQTAWTKLEQRELLVPFSLDPAIQANDKIEFQITLSNDDGYIMYQTNIVKTYNPTILFDDDADTNGLANWNNGGGTWNTTNDAYSGSTAITDSPSGSYGNNTSQTLTLRNSAALDLSTSESAVVQFYAKWDLERNFDYVQFQGSTDGTNWFELCGKYTKPGANILTTRYSSSNSTDTGPGKFSSDQNNQANNQALYDGNTMSKWVMEEFVIDASNNAFLLGSSNVRFRFLLDSDSSNRADGYSTTFDGFTFDDFKVIDVKQPCEIITPTNLTVSNITTTSGNIDWDNVNSATYDLQYRKLGTSSWTNVFDISSSNFTITNLEVLTDYEVKVRSKCETENSDFSNILSFTTLDLVYCDSQPSSSTNAYISNVQVKSINNSSNQQLYSDFTSISTYLSKDMTYNIIVDTPVNQGNPKLGMTIWLDYNRDGDFDDAGEQIFFQSASNNTTQFQTSFIVPSNINSGPTRLRVILGGNSTPPSCGNFGSGEVEDYTVYLFNGLLYENGIWTPSVPTDLTGAEDIMLLDGVYNTNSDISVNSITVNSGASFNVSKENAVTVNGNITNNGEFVMQSDSNEFSSLLLSGTASGDLKYNRHVNSNLNRNDLIAPPFSGESFANFRTNNSNIVANPGETLYLFGPFDKSSSNYVTFAPSEISLLEAGKGYRTASTDNGTFTFSGASTAGTLNVPIQKTGTAFEIWNLIGNPYPSYINLEEFLNANLSELDSQSAAVYGYDADNSNGSYWTIWNLAYAAANPNTLIAPGQGFFVSSKEGGGTVTFTPSMRSAGSSDDFIAGRNNSLPEYGTIVLSTTDKSFSTDIYFTNSATLGLDVGFDASHFDTAPLDFAVYSELVNNNNGRDMAIQAINFNDVYNNAVIPLGVNANQGEQITFSLNDVNTNFDIYLEDAALNTFTLLNTSDYTFTPTSDLADTGRFYLRFDEPSLSTNESNLDRIQVYSDNNTREIIVKGILNTKTSMVLFDVQGRKILEQDLNGRDTINSVSTADFSTGIYIVQVSDNTKTISKKVIVR